MPPTEVTALVGKKSRRDIEADELLEKVISFREFNRSKPKSMLLLHGLFSGSGFWLDNLKKLKDYKIILCDIDYKFFFREDEHCIRQLEDYVANKKNLTIVSHSFGSSLNAWLNKSFLRINICPILANSRTNNNLFISEIKKKQIIETKILLPYLKMLKSI